MDPTVSGALPERRGRRALAINERKIRIDREWWYLWASIDLDSKEVLAVHLTTTRSHLDTLVFLSKLVRTCANRPIVYVDGGPRYPWALRRYGFPDDWRTFGPRSAIERFFSLVDHRYRRFWERFPFRSTTRSLLRWAEAFGGVHNMRRSLS